MCQGDVRDVVKENLRIGFNFKLIPQCTRGLLGRD